MTSRRRTRETALQFLFSYDLNRAKDFEEQLEDFCERFSVSRKSFPYFFKLVYGVKSRWKEIDELLAESSEHWKIRRMASVDRNIMRVAIFEMLYCEDVPARVAINEAIEIGKRYGTENSSAFINGVLDRINRKFGQGDNMVPESKSNPEQDKE
ncbi:MAG: transcription antitermination factor NusB [Desulfococcus sp. 4484_241]|nr:MAG: transcription antitermination factor NusB [Desulfococcus sp. 4484_241]